LAPVGDSDHKEAGQSAERQIVGIVKRNLRVLDPFC